MQSRKKKQKKRNVPEVGQARRAALVASCLRGALPPTDLRAVCFVRAMVVGNEVVVEGVFEGVQQSTHCEWIELCSFRQCPRVIRIVLAIPWFCKSGEQNTSQVICLVTYLTKNNQETILAVLLLDNECCFKLWWTAVHIQSVSPHELHRVQQISRADCMKSWRCSWTHNMNAK